MYSGITVIDAKFQQTEEISSKRFCVTTTLLLKR